MELCCCNLLPHLILVRDLLIREVGDRHLVVTRLSDLVLRPLVCLAGVEEIPQGLVINFNKAGCEGELKTEKKKHINLLMTSPAHQRSTDPLTTSSLGCTEQFIFNAGVSFPVCAHKLDTNGTR